MKNNPHKLKNTFKFFFIFEEMGITSVVKKILPILLVVFTLPIEAQVFAIDDVDSTDEEASIVIDVQLNDINLGVGELHTFLITFPANGTATVLSGDSIEYTPFLNYFGIDTFTYEVYNDDEFPASGTAQVVITILPLPDFPIALDDYDTTEVEGAKLIDVQSNDINFDPEFLVTSLVSDPLNGTADVIGGVSMLYTPADDYFGNDSFTYSVCNPSAPGFCDTATVFVHIKEINFFQPLLVDDFVEILAGNSQTINVLANDSDGDSDGLYVSELTDGGITGTYSLNGDYTITYNAISPSIDTIFYKGCDFNSPSYCDTAKLIVTVTEPEDPASNLEIPNSFSPNGDGYNDYFVIEGLNLLSSFNLKIFNRWGDIVFENTDLNILWDGSSNVKSILPTGKLPEGTYFYVLQTGGADTYQGYIEMRR
ncbi:MAG: Ig-like domain-containing protein [Chitinophagales bacterium]